MSHALPDSLLLPVETLNREFDGKLLLAMHAVQRGYHPVIGSRTQIHDQLTRFPPSIYLAKGIRTGNATVLRLLETFGHLIVSLDEEALIRPDDDAFLMMLDDATFNRARLLYAWGDSNAELWRRFSGYRGTPIETVGNPRVDMLRPELRGYFDDDVARLRERFGHFVLFSSNFSLVNHYIPNHVRMRFARGVDREEATSYREKMLAHKRRLFEDLQALLPRLADAIYPNTLVIRPHPSESHEVWRRVAAGHGNIRVVHEGPIVPWLVAASALLHSGCTSGVEAVVLGTPAFAYRPDGTEAGEAILPNSVSFACRTPDEVIDGIRSIFAENGSAGLMNEAQRHVLRQHIASLDGALSCERILHSLEVHGPHLAGPSELSAGRRARAHLSFYKRRLARAVRTRQANNKSSRRYTAHKFPGISEAEVNTRIERFSRTMPHLPAVRARVIARDIFVIEPSRTC
ncbi:surface carbohydrate biosynthesis protein [Rhodoligotrophos defluvii]|uniref:surface carbohydrate biosynthesis protein n=1 Tax=Rhodoligotrophos defluvii TaxID=2561934 RepID=UPI001484D7A0|nr:surface carbohydrate biosynthesis protein [Rhodoligotrophos defluvii]